MLRRYLRALSLVIGGLLAQSAQADEPAPPPQAVKVVAVAPEADAYRAATPYNATVIGRTAPNPLNNRPNFTLPCDLPNQNLDSFILTKPECLKKLFGGLGGDCGGCGSWGGKLGKGTHGCGVGNCATCNNTYNFIWGGSRSYFGESSREFFERPASVDGLRHKWNPQPVIYRTGY
jgi:hypothetical protein